MKRIIVDGSFIGKNITGVQRFNWETLKELVKIPELKVYVAVPEDVNLDKFNIENVEIIRKGKKNNKFWQLFTLKKIANKIDAPLLCMSNYSPFFRKDYIVLHDVTYLDKEGKNKLFWSLCLRFLIGFRISKHKKIFTVSEFSRKRILHHYPKIKPEQVVVVGNGGGHWQHIGVEKPDLKNIEDYYLSVGSTTNNKNFNYIIRLAEQNKDKNFIVVGRIDGDYQERTKNMPNIEYTGYISNENLHYLYKHCKGFILPSFYEGFGLPPLEALNCGCCCIALSDIEVFREVYGTVANFFDPYDYDNTINLDLLKTADEDSVQELINKISWKNCAKIIFENLET